MSSSASQSTSTAQGGSIGSNANGGTSWLTWAIIGAVVLIGLLIWQRK